MLKVHDGRGSPVTVGVIVVSTHERMSRASWNFATAVPVCWSGVDEDSGLLGGGRDGRAAEVVFDRDCELGEVCVADDAAELPFGFEHPGGCPTHRYFS